jgi:hypothetical protein
MDPAAAAAGLPPSPRFKLLFLNIKTKHSFLYEALNSVCIGYCAETMKENDENLLNQEIITAPPPSH